MGEVTTLVSLIHADERAARGSPRECPMRHAGWLVTGLLARASSVYRVMGRKVSLFVPFFSFVQRSGKPLEVRPREALA